LVRSAVTPAYRQIDGVFATSFRPNADYLSVSDYPLLGRRLEDAFAVPMTRKPEDTMHDLGLTLIGLAGVAIALKLSNEPWSIVGIPVACLALWIILRQIRRK
jgi:hypothetical protein